MKSFKEVDFLEFAQYVSEKVYIAFNKYYRHKLLSGYASINYEDNFENSVKSVHKIDRFVKEIITQALDERFTGYKDSINIYMEDFKVCDVSNPKCCIFIDPVDGSRSADQHIGDPCIMMAYSPKTDMHNLRFRDLESCFIKGLHSGDVYFTYYSKGYFIPNGYTYRLHDEKVTIDETFILNPLKRIDNTSPITLGDSCVVVRDGYGMRSIVSNKVNHSILNYVKHTFSYDITGIELCYLASGRDIIHILVEARSHFKDGKQVGSDGFNLIPYPLIKAVGGMLYTLEGEELEHKHYNPYNIYDFVSTANDRLMKECINRGLIKAIF